MARFFMAFAATMMTLFATAVTAATTCKVPRQQAQLYQASLTEEVDPPTITSIYVKKSTRCLYLLHGKQVIKAYPIQLGFTPEGDKQVQGDGKTPEGVYMINVKNPYSQFHLSLGINYPSKEDRQEAWKLGRSPGGEIFIHGIGPKARRAFPNKDLTRFDWTRGCIALSDEHIEEIYPLIKEGTPIRIDA